MTIDLPDGRIARVLVEQRCERCRMWLEGEDAGHGSLDTFATTGICTGKGAGRKRTRVFVASPTDRERRQIAEHFNGHAEYHYTLRWHIATPAERREALTGNPK
jgi:hypothetical protein